MTTALEAVVNVRGGRRHLGEHRWNSPPGFGATLLLAVPAPAPSVRCGRERSRSLCSRALGSKRGRPRVRGEIFPAWGSDRLLCRASERSSLRNAGLARTQAARLDRLA